MTKKSTETNGAAAEVKELSAVEAFALLITDPMAVVIPKSDYTDLQLRFNREKGRVEYRGKDKTSGDWSFDSGPGRVLASPTSTTRFVIKPPPTPEERFNTIIDSFGCNAAQVREFYAMLSERFVAKSQAAA